MTALQFFIDLIKRGGLDSWEAPYLKLAAELEANTGFYKVDYEKRIVYSNLNNVTQTTYQTNPLDTNSINVDTFYSMYDLPFLLKEIVDEQKVKALEQLANDTSNLHLNDRIGLIRSTFLQIEELKSITQGSSSFLPYPSIYESLDYLTEEILWLNNPQKTHKNIPFTAKPEGKSYQRKINGFKVKTSKSDKEKLKTLFEGLVDARLISLYPFGSNEKAHRKVWSNFRKLFSGDYIETPVIWEGDVNELAYFVEALMQKTFLVPPPKQKHWTITIESFITKSGDKFKRSTLKTADIPKSKALIDSIFSHL